MMITTVHGKKTCRIDVNEGERERIANDVHHYYEEEKKNLHKRYFLFLVHRDDIELVRNRTMSILNVRLFDQGHEMIAFK